MVTVKNNTTPLSGWAEKAEFNRFGIISAALTAVGCMGGIAVGMGGIEATWSLILILIPTMTSLSLILSVGPIRGIVYSSIAAIAIDCLLLIYFAIA
ncbi:MAG: hypothetical protein ACI865_001356 [Flavobacteriaceae bacterium]|jgi:hypothetical protein